MLFSFLYGTGITGQESNVAYTSVSIHCSVNDSNDANDRKSRSCFIQVLARSEIIPLKPEGSSLNSPAVDQCTIPRHPWCIMISLIIYK